ncbi:MAG: PAS domain-containing protein [Alphaproteobacteria bacterium]
MAAYAFGKSKLQSPFPNLEITGIDQPVLEDSKILLGFYETLPKTDGLPRKRDVDPFTIPRSVLPSCYLLEPADDYSDWTYRLIGTEIVERFRVDRTGQNLRSFMNESRAQALIDASNESARQRCVRVYRLTPKQTAMEDFYAETMSLPVMDERNDKVWLFGGTFFGRAVPRDLS